MPQVIQIESAQDLANALYDLERRLRGAGEGSLPSRVETTREELARLFSYVREMESLQGREYALQLLVRADSRLDPVEETRDEGRLVWASHDLLQAAAWLEGANAEPLTW